MAHSESMSQLGYVVKRIIHCMEAQQNFNLPFKFAKLDVKDGFWRIAVADADTWNFCYVLPSLTHCTSLDDIEIVVSNCLQMGWCKSPPFLFSGY